MSEKILAGLHDFQQEFRTLQSVFKGQVVVTENFLKQLRDLTETFKQFFSNKRELVRFVQIKNERVFLGVVDEEKISQFRVSLKKSYSQIIFLDRNLSVKGDFNPWSSFFQLDQLFKTQTIGEVKKLSPVPVYSLTQLPFWNSPQARNDYQKVLGQLLQGSSKDVLVVSSSFNGTQNFAQRFQCFFKAKGYSVFTQGISGGRSKISEKIKENPPNVIIGTPRFLKGIEINSIDRLIILNLPFQSPENPLVLAESLEAQDIFTQIILPQAVLDFKNILAFILERGTKDSQVLVLDTRFTQEEYSAAFRELPPCFKLESFKG